MTNNYGRRILFTALFAIFMAIGAFAQTITVGNPDPGPYAPGSTIAVPVTVNDATGCVAQGNTYTLYLSDAAGNFTPGTAIGTFNGFYTTFVNGKIPPGTLPGTYKLEVKSSNPAVTSNVSTTITINAGTGVVAGATSQILS